MLFCPLPAMSGPCRLTINKYLDQIKDHATCAVLVFCFLDVVEVEEAFVDLFLDILQVPRVLFNNKFNKNMFPLTPSLLLKRAFVISPVCDNKTVGTSVLHQLQTIIY